MTFTHKLDDETKRFLIELVNQIKTVKVEVLVKFEKGQDENKN
jgi:hypothetical protein